MERKYKLKRDTVDLRDLHYSATNFAKTLHLPSIVDLREKCSPIVDQQDLGSCTANAIASGLREYLLLRSGIPLTRLSRLFLYYEERLSEGTVGDDSGAMIRDGMKVLQQMGVCPESEWSYDTATFTNGPTVQEIRDARDFAIKKYHRISTLPMLKVSLAEGYPVVIGIEIYESFETDSVASTGIVPLPEWREECLGGHAVCVVGYDDSLKHLIVRNSWGTEWGDKGYFYLPYEYYTEGYVTDAWTGN